MNMGTTLHEALSEAMAAHEPELGAVAQDPQNVQEGEMSPLVDERVETTEQKAERIRDEAGRFAKGQQPEKGPQSNAEAPAVEPRKPPSSWKKEYWEHYQKLDPKLAEYIEQREQQFASGVSTYKQEAERAKEIHEAIAPFAEDLQAANMSVPQWIRQLGGAHQILYKGGPEQKLQALDQIVQGYKIPARIAVQDAQGNWQLLDARQLPAPQPQMPDVEKIVEEKLQQRYLSEEVKKFAAEHPHYETVREQMSGLLQTGMAQDLNDAYAKALKLNDELWNAEQQRLTQENAEKQRQEQQAKVNKARANAVSPRGSTPVGDMGSAGKKGLRDIIAEQVDAVVDGRV